MYSNLSLSPYSMYKQEEGALLITNLGVSRVSLELRDLVSSLERNFEQTISQLDQDSIELLKQCNVIYEKKESNQYFDSTVRAKSLRPIVISDDEFIGNALNEWISKTTIASKEESPLYVSILTSYAPQSVSQLYKQIGKNEFVKTAYVLGGNLIIDNLYSPSKGIPCHFCMKWNRIEPNSPLDLFSANALVNEAPIAKSKNFDYVRAIIVNAVINDLSKVLIERLAFSNNWLTTTVVDLLSGRPVYDTPLTSSNCNCQKGLL